MSRASGVTRIGCRALTAICAVLGAASCADSSGRIDGPTSAPRTPQASFAEARGHIIRVQAGTSIQAAVNAAGGDVTILVEPGTYRETVSITAPGVRLLGLGVPGAVVVENPGAATNGIRVAPTGDGFELDNVTVRGFIRNGVVLSGVDGFRLTRVRADGNGAYGLFPIRSSHGLIADCVATGAADTGIYVGQSTDITIRNSTAWGNVIGFAIENTTRVSLEGNNAYDNTVGVLLALVPGLPVMAAADNVVAHNAVFDNNRANFGEPDDLAGLLPSGVGMLVIGPDRTVVAHNAVTGNRSTGIAVVSASLIISIAGLPPNVFGDIDPNPDGTRVEHNVVTGNGTAATVSLFPGVDVLWDGSGVGNCWEKNRFGTSVPVTLPACE